MAAAWFIFLARVLGILMSSKHEVDLCAPVHHKVFARNTPTFKMFRGFNSQSN